MKFFSLVSGLIPVALQTALVAIFVRRKLHRNFPFFFISTVYAIPVTLARLWTMESPVAFFVIYWTTEMAYSVLALLAVFEVFQTTVQSYFGRQRDRWALPIALSAVSTIAFWRGAFHPMGYTKMAHFAVGAYAFTLGVLCLEILVFLICLRLSLRRPYPVRWGRYRLGIIAGFGLSASASASAYLIRFIFGARFEVVFHYVLPGAYIGATLVWLIAFWKEEPPFTRKPTGPDALKRARRLITEATEDAKKKLGPRYVSSRELLHAICLERVSSLLVNPKQLPSSSPVNRFRWLRSSRF